MQTVSMFVGALLTLAVLDGCSGTRTSCTGELRLSVNASVVDATSGRAICNATVVARDGAFQEALIRRGGADASAESACIYVGVGERKGVYSVDVVAPGYESAARTVTVSRSNGCHVMGEHIDVRLTAQ